MTDENLLTKHKVEGKFIKDKLQTVVLNFLPPQTSTPPQPKKPNSMQNFRAIV